MSCISGLTENALDLKNYVFVFISTQFSEEIRKENKTQNHFKRKKQH